MILSDAPESDIIDCIKWYKHCFSEFYLEIQPGNFKEQTIVNNRLIQLSRKTNTPIIVTNDVHYLHKEDAITHDWHIKLDRKEFSTQMIYKDSCYYVMDRDTIIDSFNKTIPNSILQIALDRTNRIANTVEPYDIDISVHMPSPIDDMQNDIKLAQLAYDGFNKISLMISDPSVYMSRLQYELDSIKELNFSGYFLVVADYVNFCKTNHIIVGPGRGSVCGSLVAYLIGITEVDPIKYKLLFERFLSRYRKGSIPDIDTDYCPKDRPKIIQHILDTYGYDHCALVSTLGMRKIKKAIHDAARILNIEVDTANAITKSIPNAVYDDEGNKKDPSFESLSGSDFCTTFQRKYPELYELSYELSGYPSYKSLHAAGILISPIALTNKIPLIQSKTDQIMATDLTLEDAENAGFVKMDLLILKNLSVCQNTQKMTPVNFDYRDDSYLHDEAVWDIIGSNQTIGLFQISSKTYSTRMKQLHPHSIEELANILALLRGPCISTGADQTYIKRLNGEEPIQMIHQVYDQATQDTYGVLLYQEQIMQICINIGFDMETSFKIMKALSKKKSDLTLQYHDQFVRLMNDKHVDDDVIDYIWSLLINASKYCFNKSHAVAYALLSYYMAYLRIHAPVAFFANLLTYEYSKETKKRNVKGIISFIRKNNIAKIISVDINHSEWDYTITKQDDSWCIREGFCSIKSLGEKAFLELKRVRQQHTIHTIQDLLLAVNRRACNISVVRALISAKCFGHNCNKLLEGLDDTVKEVNKIKKKLEKKKEVSIDGKK
jgi:DNA polymerase-3 subunit alpha